MLPENHNHQEVILKGNLKCKFDLFPLIKCEMKSISNTQATSRVTSRRKTPSKAGATSTSGLTVCGGLNSRQLVKRVKTNLVNFLLP